TASHVDGPGFAAHLSAIAVEVAVLVIDQWHELSLWISGNRKVLDDRFVDRLVGSRNVSVATLNDRVAWPARAEEGKNRVDRAGRHAGPMHIHGRRGRGTVEKYRNALVARQGTGRIRARWARYPWIVRSHECPHVVPILWPRHGIAPFVAQAPKNVVIRSVAREYVAHVTVVDRIDLTRGKNPPYAAIV